LGVVQLNNLGYEQIYRSIGKLGHSTCDYVTRATFALHIRSTAVTASAYLIHVVV
jgi:hypothetical protein